MELQQSKTRENLRKALAGESIARNKYTYFAAAARAAGDTDIADAFEEMARNEMAHARLWYEALYGKPESTESSLKLAAHGEYEEWHQMYPDFAAQAREEGMEDLAVMFEQVAEIERSHENRFMTLLLQLSHSPQAPAKEETVYRCQFCGAMYESRPDVCKVCQAIGAFEQATVRK